MLHENTLNKIRESHLKCVEYEIGMFLCLLTNPDEIKSVIEAASTRDDYKEILGIANNINKESILNILSYSGMSFNDVSFESQNDNVGPADIVIYATDRHGELKKIGVSIKYNNDVIYNYTGNELLTPDQKIILEEKLPVFANRYLQEMIEKFGSFQEWYRIRFGRHTKITSVVTNEYIDLIRDAVLERWGNMSQEEKDIFLYRVYRTDSPLDYWIYNFQKRGRNILCTNPPYIRRSEYPSVSLRKIAGQYLGFYIDGKLLGKTQVKFNNGILEKYNSRSYNNALENNNQELAERILSRDIQQRKCIVYEGIPLKLGSPFSSWNFEISY